MNAAQEYLKKAQEVVASAIALDEKGFPADAIQTYMKALEWFEMAAKYEPNPTTRARIQDKMGDYVHRIEILKKKLQWTPIQKVSSIQRTSCDICHINNKPGGVSKCNVCINVACSDCMHTCELCHEKVCDKDLDRMVVGNICNIHTIANTAQLNKPIQSNNCNVCYKLSKDLYTCDVCNKLNCSKCIYTCDLCHDRVCERDLDRAVSGNICIYHASPKEVQTISKNVTIGKDVTFSQTCSADASCHMTNGIQQAETKSQELIVQPIKLIEQIQPGVVLQEQITIDLKPPIENIQKGVQSEQENDEEDDKEDDKHKSTDCIICFEDIKGPSAVVPCGHVGFCYDCLKPTKLCPICREPITHILKIYGQ